MVISYHEINSVITNIHVPMFIPRLLVPIGAVAICLVLSIDLLHFLEDIKRRD